MSNNLVKWTIGTGVVFTLVRRVLTALSVAAAAAASTLNFASAVATRTIGCGDYKRDFNATSFTPRARDSSVTITPRTFAPHRLLPLPLKNSVWSVDGHQGRWATITASLDVRNFAINEYDLHIFVDVDFFCAELNDLVGCANRGFNLIRLLAKLNGFRIGCLSVLL